MKRLRDVGVLVSLFLAVAGCGRAPEGDAAPAGAPSSSAPATTAPGPAPPPPPPVPPTSKWTLDPENSSVQFVCKHVLTNVRGMLSKPSGTVTLDEATPANSKVDVRVDVGSITTGVEERDTHLKGADFFDVA